MAGTTEVGAISIGISADLTGLDASINAAKGKVQNAKIPDKKVHVLVSVPNADLTKARTDIKKALEGLGALAGKPMELRPRFKVLGVDVKAMQKDLQAGIDSAVAKSIQQASKKGSHTVPIAIKFPVTADLESAATIKKNLEARISPVNVTLTWSWDDRQGPPPTNMGGPGGTRPRAPRTPSGGTRSQPAQGQTGAPESRREYGQERGPVPGPGPSPQGRGRRPSGAWERQPPTMPIGPWAWGPKPTEPTPPPPNTLTRPPTPPRQQAPPPPAATPPGEEPIPPVNNRYRRRMNINAQAVREQGVPVPGQPNVIQLPTRPAVGANPNALDELRWKRTLQERMTGDETFRRLAREGGLTMRRGAGGTKMTIKPGSMLAGLADEEILNQLLAKQEAQLAARTHPGGAPGHLRTLGMAPEGHAGRTGTRLTTRGGGQPRGFGGEGPLLTRGDLVERVGAREINELLYSVLQGKNPEELAAARNATVARKMGDIKFMHSFREKGYGLFGRDLEMAAKASQEGRTDEARLHAQGYLNRIYRGHPGYIGAILAGRKDVESIAPKTFLGLESALAFGAEPLMARMANLAAPKAESADQRRMRAEGSTWQGSTGIVTPPPDTTVLTGDAVRIVPGINRMSATQRREYDRQHGLLNPADVNAAPAAERGEKADEGVLRGGRRRVAAPSLPGTILGPEAGIILHPRRPRKLPGAMFGMPIGTPGYEGGGKVRPYIGNRPDLLRQMEARTGERATPLEPEELPLHRFRVKKADGSFEVRERRARDIRDLIPELEAWKAAGEVAEPFRPREGYNQSDIGGPKRFGIGGAIGRLGLRAWEPIYKSTKLGEALRSPRAHSLYDKLGTAGAEKRIQKVFPNADVFLGMNPIMARRVAKEVEGLAKRYPSTARDMRAFGTMPDSFFDARDVPGASGLMEPDALGAQIFLNEKLFDPRRGLRDRLARMANPRQYVMSKQRPILDYEDTDDLRRKRFTSVLNAPPWQYAIAHEFGHALDWQYTDAISAHLGPRRLKRIPSQYATRNPQENMAELFARHYLKGNKSIRGYDRDTADTLQHLEGRQWGGGGEQYEPRDLDEDSARYRIHPQKAGEQKPVIVGEAGQEVFVPESAGWIIPHHLMEQLPKRQAGGATGGATGGVDPHPILTRRTAMLEQVIQSQVGGWSPNALRNALTGSPDFMKVATRVARTKMAQANMGLLVGQSVLTAQAAPGAAIGNPATAGTGAGFRFGSEKELKKWADLLGGSIKQAVQQAGGGAGAPPPGAPPGAGAPLPKGPRPVVPMAARKSTPVEVMEAKIRAREEAAPMEERIRAIREQATEALQMAPARALSTAGGQLLANLTWRRGIQTRTKDVNDLAKKASQYDNDEKQANANNLKERAKLRTINDQIAKIRQQGGPQTEREVTQYKALEASQLKQVKLVGDYRIAAQKAHGEAERLTAQGEEQAKHIVTPLAAMGNLLTLGVGVGAATIGYRALFTVMQKGIEEVGQVLTPFIDQLTGWANTSAKVMGALGDQTQALHGWASVATANAELTANMSNAMVKAIDPTLQLTAAQTGANKSFQSQIDLQRTALYNAQGVNGLGGVPRSFTQTTGGEMGTWVNGIPSIAEQFGDFMTQLRSMVPASAVKNAVSMGEQTAAGRGPVPFNIGGAWDTLVGGAHAARSNVVSAQALEMTPVQRLAREQEQAYVANMTAAGKQYGVTIGEVADQGAAAKASADYIKQLFGNDSHMNKVADSLQSWNISIQGLKGTYDEQRAQVAALINSAALPSLQAALQQLTPQVKALQSFMMSQLQVQREQIIPAQAAMQFFAQPPLAPGVGIIPGATKQATLPGPMGPVTGAVSAGPTATTSEVRNLRLSADSRNRITSSLKEDIVLYDKLNKLEADGLQAAKDFADANLPAKEAADFKAGLDTVTEVGKQIQGLQSAIAERDIALQIMQYNNQLRIASRSLVDIEQLQGKLGKTAGDNLGIYERQDVMLGRQATKLQLMLQQRAITTAVAIAGFGVPGETPEIRYQKQKEAKLQAAVQQEQLNIQKQLFANSIKEQEIGWARNHTDLVAEMGLLTTGRSTAHQDALDAAKEALLQTAQQLQIAKNTASFGSAVEWQNTMAGYAQQIAGTLSGTTFSQAMETLQSWGKQQGWVGETRGQPGTGKQVSPGGQEGGLSTGSTVPVKPQKNIPGAGRAYEPAASGWTGYTSGATNMVVGEAGGEYVAVLSHPRDVSVTPQNGGGNGAVVININNPSVRNESDIQAIAREVERVLSRKLQLTGARGPSY